MVRETQDKIFINGSNFADLEVSEFDLSRKGMWAFLTQIVPLHPWIAGLASIVSIVAFSNNQLPWVQVVAIGGVTLITVVSTWKRSSNERSKTTNEPSYVREDAISDRSSKGDVGRRFTIGSDPPISGTHGALNRTPEER